MYFTGFADEASGDIAKQIEATRALGWNNIEMRSVFNSNIAFISDAQFDELSIRLEKAAIKVNCFGSGIGNWAKLITDSPESSYDELKKALPRLERLGTKLVRIMSFAVPCDEWGNAWKYEDEVAKRVSRIVELAADHGVTCLHENCNNWAGLSWEHTLRLMERVKSPYLKLVFDTGNPVFHEDCRGKEPFKMQSAWEFYEHVRDFVAYIHIKDGRMENGKPVFTFPDEGDAGVSKILADAFGRGYDGGISIEPHMGKVFHDSSVTNAEDYCYNNYIEYGRRIEKIVAKIKGA